MGRDREKGGRGGGDGQREKGRRRRRETLGICGPPASFRTCGLPACVHTCELPASKCACDPPASKCACDPPASYSREDMCGVCRFRVAMLHARSYCVCVCVSVCVAGNSEMGRHSGGGKRTEVREPDGQNEPGVTGGLLGRVDVRCRTAVRRERWLRDGFQRHDGIRM